MTYLSLFLSAFVVALSGAMMPGPLLAVTLGHSPRHGWAFGPLAILGHGILELGLVSVVFLGAGPLLQTQAVKSVVGLVGGCILVWMGVGMMRTARAGLSASAPGGQARTGRAVAMGIVASISNPYWTIWWATIGLGFLTVAAAKGPLGVGVFFAGHIGGDLFWYTLVSIAASRGANMTGTRGYRVLLSVCAVTLVVFGGWFVWYGLSLA